MNRLVLLLLLVSVCSNADDAPLFASDEPLEIVFEFPLDVILKQADKRPVVEGHASYTDTAGDQVSISIKMTSRGRSRLEYCRFPPLSVTFNKRESKGTIFEGQKKKLKIVTHCRATAAHRKYLLQEQTIYEAFNVLTDISFRTRYMSVTYRNSNNPDHTINESAFLIENIAEVADRNQLKRKKVGKIPESQLDPAYTTLSALFQFLIGNTDWSVIAGPDKNDCCHNSKPLSPRKADTGWLVVHYDFDQAGLINTRYAVVANPLPIKTVRQRLFRGRCIHSGQIEPAIAIFNESRQQLEMALMPGGSSDHKSTSAYIDDFYRIISDPKQRERYLNKPCVGRK